MVPQLDAQRQRLIRDHCARCEIAGFFEDIYGIRIQEIPDATKIVSDMRRIVNPKGVERLEKVRIGGIDQWLNIRGQDRRNPVLLMIHGGPGFVSMPLSWYFQRGWEEYFTVVQWDQRGSGKTYTSNDPVKIAPGMTPERMYQDADEVILWLRKEFGKDKIFVLGHSWGSSIGLTVAKRHPEWLHAYIGMAQMTNSPESERRGWQFALEHAEADHNEQAIHDLRALAPYAVDGKPLPLKDLYLQRKWLDYYGGAIAWKRDFKVESAAVRLSPEYTDADVRSFGDGNEFSEQYLLAQAIMTDFSTVTTLKCPLILFSGRHDYNVSSTVGAEWFERVQAPSKRLVWFESSAHEIMDEEPGKLLLSLVEYARPIAQRAGDVPIGK
ncbi:MAG TPA: alpha/beta hydrolase [Steroidobacteraceae bacterium]|nr:alpha/beta hydrolase [Steroidobacteraceae bacterium]